MFPYDPLLSRTVASKPQTITDVLKTLGAIQSICEDGDGLKWFNWLYLQVTLAVKKRIGDGGTSDPVWLTKLDVQFASLYLNALKSYLSNNRTPDCWQTVFASRAQTRIARIQFALAGINAHITHDLPEAIVATCNASGIVPTHGIPEFQDYTSLNATLEGIVESAKKTLRRSGRLRCMCTNIVDICRSYGASPQFFTAPL